MLRAVFSKDCWFLRFTALLHHVIPVRQGNKPCLDSHIAQIQPTKTAWLLPVRPHWTQNTQHFLSSITHKFQWDFSFLFPFSQCEVSLIFSLTFSLQWFCPVFQVIQLHVSLLAPLYLPCSLEKVSTAEPPPTRASTNPALLNWGTEFMGSHGLGQALTAATIEILILIYAFWLCAKITEDENWMRRGISSPAAFQLWRVMAEWDTVCNIPGGFKIVSLL